MTDEELRNLVASTAQATAANTVGLAESRRLLDEGLAETRRIIDANANSTAEGLVESRRLLDEGLAETRQLINSNARATEANSNAISKLGEKVDQIDDAVVGLFERLDERLDRSDQQLDRLTNEFEHRLGQLIDLQMANAQEHADFVARSHQHDQQVQILIEENRSDRQQASADRDDFTARSHQHDQQIQTLIEEGRADRAAAAARAEESDRKHLAATELIQQMFGEIQHINQRLAS